MKHFRTDQHSSVPLLESDQDKPLFSARQKISLELLKNALFTWRHTYLSLLLVVHFSHLLEPGFCYSAILDPKLSNFSQAFAECISSLVANRIVPHVNQLNLKIYTAGYHGNCKATIRLTGSSRFSKAAANLTEPVPDTLQLLMSR